MAVQQYPVLAMPPHRARQCERLGVLADRGEAGGVVGVVDSDHFLLDDRPLVEVGGDVVRRRADQLDASVVAPGGTAWRP